MQGLPQALSLFSQGRHAEARVLCEHIVERDRSNATAYALLGTLCAMQGDPLAAASSLKKALLLDPRHVMSHYVLGNLLREAGQLDEAAASYRRALALRGDLVDAQLNLGLVHFEQGALDAAITCFQRVLVLAPGDWRAHFNLGNAYQASGRTELSLPTYEQAIRLQPGFADAHYNHANALQSLGRLAEAVAGYRDVIALQPNHAAAHANLGRALKASGQLPAAIAVYGQAVRHDPGSALAHCNLANALRESGDLDAALASCDRALSLAAEYADAHLARGLVLHDLWRPDEALASYRRADQLQSSPSVEVCNNMGTLLATLGSLPEAIACFARALQAQPDHAECQHNMGMAFLSLGQFERGWPMYEARLRVPRLWNIDAVSAARRWNGDIGLARQLVVISEQGYGDTIQFARYGELLNQMGLRPILQTDARLQALMSSCPYFSEVIAHSQHGEVSDRPWIALLSLPLLLKTRLDTIPAPRNYLCAQQDRQLRWATRLESGARMRVGIAWQGNAAAEVLGLRGRSVPLTAFEQLVHLPGIQFISLQRGAGAEQLASVGFRDRIVDCGAELDAGSDAFLDTAAVMGSLDLVISSDTAIAHLAGALGIPVWVALHSSPDWRWLRVRSDSPWYPSMKLFRQSEPGNWSTVFAEMTGELSRAAGTMHAR